MAADLVATKSVVGMAPKPPFLALYLESMISPNNTPVGELENYPCHSRSRA